MNWRRLFLPSAENDYTPHLLQRAAMVGMFVLVLLSFAATNLQALLWQSSDWLVGTVLPAVVVNLTNQERANQAAVPLVRNTLLDEAARLKAEHMAKYGYFAHYSPDGVSPWYWFERVDYTYAHAGENLAIHFTDSSAVVDAWMKSPTHRANIVNNTYTEIGVGTAKGTFDGFSTVFVVQLFGTPAAPVVAAAPTPAPVVPAPVLLSIPEPEPLVSETTQVAQVVEEVSSEEPLTIAMAPEEVLGTTEDTVAVEAAPTPTPAEEAVVVEPFEVAEVVTDPARTSVFSTHFATSSGLPPVVSSVGSVSGTTADSFSFVQVAATQPSTVLQAVYLGLGMLVATLLLLSIIIGIHHTRPLQVVYGVGLILLMSGLFYVHVSLTTSVVIAATPEVVELLQ
jgi:hypothetical protein